MTDGSRFPLEAPCRLSRSVLWRLQRRFFEHRGVAAWSEGVVPHHVTSNPALARAYARVVLGALRDWRAALDPAEPLYIVELGAGAGRLGFHFVRAFERLLDGSVFRGQPWRYVLTDFAEANVAAWRAHPRLAAWLAGGRLDLARFDAERDAVIALEPSGAVLAPGGVRNPLVVIANYVFDGLPLDGFTVVDGRLHEWRVRLCSTAPDADLDDPELLARVRLTYDRQPVDAAGYYGDPALDRLLDEHRAELPGTGFTFPSGSLACLARLAEIAGGRMLVLSTDKGEVERDALRGRPGPAITLHGSFSIEVNYHAIARWFHDRGGVALVPEARPRTIATCAFALGGGECAEGCAGGWIETRQAYGEAIAAQSPDDRFAIEQSVEPSYPALTLDRWIAYLRHAEYDPKLVGEALPFLVPLAGAANQAERDELLRVAMRSWDGYLHIGEAGDFGFALGTLATVLGAWREALALFEGSLRWYGPTPAALFELARCHRQLGELAAARARLDEALVIDPAHPPAIALAAELAAGAAP